MSRIINLQRQARELGRLRMGTFDGDHPTRSETWIITSHSQEYVEAAADEWGGTAEKWTPQASEVAQWRVITDSTSLDAIMPPGDPLTQSYEQWNRGGVVRRCDSVTEKVSGKPCLCIAKYGEDWHEAGKKDVCAITSRFSVILPQMPDIGVWRMESHSYYAATEISAHVDLIRSSIGEAYAVPIRLRIEPRDRMIKGKPRHYSVPVVELRGVVAGQVLAGQIPAAAMSPIGTAAERPAIEAAKDEPVKKEAVKPTREQFMQFAQLAKNPIQVTRLGEEAKAAGVLDDDLSKMFRKRYEELGGRPKSAGGSQAIDTLWSKIVGLSTFDSTAELETDFWRVTGTDVKKATAEEMRTYLAHLEGAE
jgi:hypothetical protein